MSFDYINEAFKKLNMLDEDVFDTSVGGLNNLANFMDNDDEDIVKVIDPEAETNDELSGSYVGKVIIDCNVCHSKIFSAKEDVVLTEDGIVNPDEQCPYCGETSGFTVIGEITPFENEAEEPAEDSAEDATAEEPVEETPVEESLNEELESDNDESVNELFDVKLDARGFGGSGNNVSVLGGKIPAFESVDDEELEEGIFGGNKYKGKDILVYRGNGKDEPLAVSDTRAGNYNLIYFKQAHAKKNGNKESDYTHVAATDVAVKKYKKALKSIPDVSSNLPGWVNQYVKDAKAQRAQEFDNEQRRKEREAEAKRYSSRYAKKDSDDDDGRVYVQGKGFGTYKYREELEEAAFSGGMAGDNSFSGGTIRGRGASTQPSKSTYLRRLQSKNPELVDITTVKGKDIKPGMITQAGQVKTAEVKKNNRGETKVYIMHTNNYDGFWDVDEDMEVLVDPENKSQPFTGSYSALLKMGLQESIEDTSLTEEFDAFTAVSAFLADKGYNVSSKEGKAYVWGVVDYLDLGNIEPTRDNLETWLSNTLSFEEYKAELEAACGMNEAVESDNLDEAYFKPVDGEPGVKRALIDSCDEFTVTLLEITDEDGTWYEVGINHPTKDFEQVEIGEYRTAEFAESIAQKVVSMLNKYVELEELTSIYEFGTRSIYDKVASRMPETEPTTEELNEDIQNLSLTTDETQVKLTSDENGKVTLVTEPVIKEEAEPEVVEEEPAVDSELEIAPVSDETVDEIVDNNEVETEEEAPVEEEELPTEEPVEGEEDVALDEVDEEGLDELGESYMKSVYENVESFKTTGVSANDTHIVVEGLIKFTSGVERKTGFIFEAYTSNADKVSFVGCNEHFSEKGNSFTLNCSVADKKLLPESLSYNYDVNGKTISGTVRRKGV